jgi:hypothetical protein
MEIILKGLHFIKLIKSRLSEDVTSKLKSKEEE